MEEPGEGEIDNGVHQHHGIFYTSRNLYNFDHYVILTFAYQGWEARKDIPVKDCQRMNLISMVNYIGPTISFMILDKVWWV